MATREVITATIAVNLVTFLRIAVNKAKEVTDPEAMDATNAVNKAIWLENVVKMAETKDRLNVTTVTKMDICLENAQMADP